MGSGAIVVGEEGRHSTQFDRHPARGVSCLDQDPADRRHAVVGNGQVLSATSLAQATQATTQIGQEEVELQQLWFALSGEQRTQFGGHFSELLLRAVRQQNEIIPTE
ncbi:MAG: hypothetical protein H8E44_46965 [Planctomycetes bacterium]|nr:hypothetical protein [Planctomycetota bacterium]